MGPKLFSIIILHPECLPRVSPEHSLKAATANIGLHCETDTYFSPHLVQFLHL